jgi:hypothetical protein
MTTIRDYIKKCEFVKANVMAEQQRIVEKNSQKITNLNKNQFTDGLGSDDKELFNTNRIYSGFYRSGEFVGQRYDFFNTGRFIQGLDLKFFDENSFNIFSNGTGTTQDKQDFFDGYTNLFGLDTYYSDIMNWEIIHPQLMDYIKKHL